MKFIYTLAEGIQVEIEAATFRAAQDEYERIKNEAASVKVNLVHKPIPKSIKRGLKEHLLELKEKEFFSSPRTLRDIREKLAELAVHYPATTFPSYLNLLVQNGILKRTRGQRDGAEVWLYENG